jgi:hypothetical protein
MIALLIYENPGRAHEDLIDVLVFNHEHDADEAEKLLTQASPAVGVLHRRVPTLEEEIEYLKEEYGA